MKKFKEKFYKQKKNNQILFPKQSGKPEVEVVESCQQAGIKLPYRTIQKDLALPGLFFVW
jgi:hypothetical protein